MTGNLPMKLDADTVIRVDDLQKKFCRVLRRSMLYGAVDMANAMLGRRARRERLREGEFWALRDVNFELKKGEALGIVGQNGSGKTTLLRLINGIFPPDAGAIGIRGRIGALIAVGAGFHPHLTGRENIYLNGTILGMTRAEIDARYADIVAFADIGDFLEAPVATYSSGMSIRLGFAIAIHATPEILLADEVLAVGDLSFALKCYRKISQFREAGGSIILVSHSVQLVRNTCQKVLWLHGGRTRSYGDAQTVCDEYEKFMSEKTAVDRDELGVRINNDPRVRIPRVEFLAPDGSPRDEHRVGDPLTVRIHYDLQRRVNRPVFTFSIADPENIQVVSNYTLFDGLRIDALEGRGSVDFRIDRLSLKPSEYRCTMTFTENEDLNNTLEWHDKAHRFRVVSNGTTSYGLFNPFPSWSLNRDDAGARG